MKMRVLDCVFAMAVALSAGSPVFASHLKIDKALVDPAEVEVLEDLVVAAIADAKAKAEAMMSEEMGKLTGGLNLPAGLKLPF